MAEKKTTIHYPPEISGVSYKQVYTDTKYYSTAIVVLSDKVSVPNMIGTLDFNE